MKVKDFNTDKGLYIFELNDIETEFHSHPAIEIMIAHAGKFSISGPGFTCAHVNFAVIDSNVKHKLLASNCHLDIIMIEHNNTLTKRILSDNKIILSDGIFHNHNESGRNYLEMLTNLVQNIATNQNENEYDTRINKVIKHIDKQQPGDVLLMKSLHDIANLSTSRFAHVFKENVGISLRKYLIWHRLKVTISLLLKNEEDLFSSLIMSGFYDQSHFSKAFKLMLGISPSAVYNSRILQV